MRKAPRTGGDTADQPETTTNNITTQELASVGPTAVESFGREPGGPLVRVEVVRYGEPTLTFLLRCGLAATGGES